MSHSVLYAHHILQRTVGERLGMRGGHFDKARSRRGAPPRNLASAKAGMVSEPKARTSDARAERTAALAAVSVLSEWAPAEKPRR